MIKPEDVKEIILGEDGRIYFIIFGTGDGLKRVGYSQLSDMVVAYGAEIENVEGEVILSDKHGKEVLEIPVQRIFRADNNGTLF